MRECRRKQLRAAGYALMACVLITGIWIWSHQPSAPARELLRSELTLRDGLLFATGEEEPFDGKLVENFSPGQRKLVIEIRGGQAHGQSCGWHESGQLEVEETFVNGVSHGQRSRWHANGKRRSLAQIDHGKVVGKFTEWHENGQKAVEMTLRDGQADGLVTAWHPSGELKSKVQFEHGKQVRQQFWAETPAPASPQPVDHP